MGGRHIYDISIEKCGQKQNDKNVNFIDFSLLEIETRTLKIEKITFKRVTLKLFQTFEIEFESFNRQNYESSSPFSAVCSSITISLTHRRRILPDGVSGIVSMK